MARPRRSDITRETLLEHGIQLLSAHGYHGTGLKRILDAVNVPKGSFYNYFNSKEAFAAEIITRYIDDLLHLFDAYVENTDDDPLTIIRNVYQVMMDKFELQGCRQGCLIGNLAAEIGGNSARCQAAMQRAFNEWRERFVRLLERAQVEGSVRADIGAGQLADLFWNAWEGGILRMKLEGSTAPLKQMIDLLLDVMFKPAPHTDEQ
mgnify:CR=1 FL=1